MLPESVSEATVLAWHKEVGEAFQRDELLIELETEKIVLEVPAPSDGELSQILKPAGETIYEGDVLGILNTSATAVKSQRQEQSESTESIQSALELAEVNSESLNRGQVKTSELLSPAARRVVDESGIDTSAVVGTGKDGRITKPDVMQAIESADCETSEAVPKSETKSLQVEQPVAPISATAPQPPTLEKAVDSGERSVRHQPMSRLRRTIADRLVQAQHSAALLTTFNEVDMSAIMALRQKHRDNFELKHGARLGFMSFFVKAAVESLKAIPAVNAIIDGNDIVYHDYCDVGIAVSSPRGLVVPILRNAQAMGFAEIEKKIRDFGERARSGALTLDELTGGTFTITNGGIFGSLVSTPIVNPPQSAILGMHKIQERAVVENGEVVARPMMYLALTYDHRIIDGREAVTFLVGIKEGLEDPSRLLLQL